LLITEKQWDRAIVVLEDFRRNFPQSPLQPDVTRKLAVAYTSRTIPVRPRWNSKRSRRPPGRHPKSSARRPCARRNCYDKAGNTAKSRAMLEAFVKHYPQPLNPAMEARNK